MVVFHWIHKYSLLPTYIGGSTGFNKIIATERVQTLYIQFLEPMG